MFCEKSLYTHGYSPKFSPRTILPDRKVMQAKYIISKI